VRVELVSPEQVLYEGEAEMVVVRTLGGGDIAFQPNHAQFLAALDVWPAKVYTEGGETLMFAVHGGFVEVSNNRVTILSDVAELADQIDLDRAREALADAEARLQADPEDDHAIAQKKRAIARHDVCGVAAGQASAAAH
jgi:F-type H+-transporting ATPase subunit epsilon